MSIIELPAGVFAEVSVEGAPALPQQQQTMTIDTPSDCDHSGTAVQVETVIALINDEAEQPHEWQVRVRGVCAKCGTPFAVDLDSARAPRDGGPGAVLTMHPIA